MWYIRRALDYWREVVAVILAVGVVSLLLTIHWYDPAVQGGIMGITGTALGVVIAFWLRNMGRIIARLEYGFARCAERNISGEMAEDSENKPGRVHVRFKVSLFNTRDRDSAANDVRIIAYAPSGKRVASARVYENRIHSTCDGIDLPARAMVVFAGLCAFEKEHYPQMAGASFELVIREVAGSTIRLPLAATFEELLTHDYPPTVDIDDLP